MTCHQLHCEVNSIYLVENCFCLTNFPTDEPISVAHMQHFRRILGGFAKDIRVVKVCRRVYAGETFGHLWNRFTVVR